MLSNNEKFISYEIYSDLFIYPNEQLRIKIEEIQKYLSEHYPEASIEFQKFTDFSKNIDIKTWEEIYTRTFDVQAITTLDIGYVLFGDDYKRGELLVNLGSEHKRANNYCGNELADHLPNLLKLLGKLDSDELRSDLITHIIKPALAKIHSEFELSHIEKKNSIYQKHHNTIIDNNYDYGLIYQTTIYTLILMLENDFQENKIDLAHENNFTKQISSELEIEKLG